MTGSTRAARTPADPPRGRPNRRPARRIDTARQSDAEEQGRATAHLSVGMVSLVLEGATSRDNARKRHPATCLRQGRAAALTIGHECARGARPTDSRRVNPRQRLLSFACAKLAVTASCLRSLRTRPSVCSMRHREPHEGEVSEALPWLQPPGPTQREDTFVTNAQAVAGVR